MSGKEVGLWHDSDTHFKPFSSKDMGLSFLRGSTEDRTAVMTLNAYQDQPTSGGGETENLLLCGLGQVGPMLAISLSGTLDTPPERSKH